MEKHTSPNEQTEWVDVEYISKHLLPLSKRKIRALIKENLDVVVVGNKLIVEKSQLLSFLRKEI